MATPPPSDPNLRPHVVPSGRAGGPKLPKHFYDVVGGTGKWTDRKEMLDVVPGPHPPSALSAVTPFKPGKRSEGGGQSHSQKDPFPIAGIPNPHFTPTLLPQSGGGGRYLPPLFNGTFC